jgi:MFS family permease
VLVLLTALVLAAGAVNVSEIFLITRTFGAGPEAYGAIGALFAAGLMLGSVLARKDREVVAAGRLLVSVTLSMALAMVVLGLAPTLALAALASTAVGVGNGMLNVTAQSIFVRRSPQALLGRVFAALQGVVGAAMLVAAGLGGALLGVIDVRVLIVGSGALAVVALLAVCRPLLVTVTRPDDEPQRPDRVALSVSSGGGEAS